MEFRYREMVYRPDYYDFYTEDRTEWFPVGVFRYRESLAEKLLIQLRVHC